MNKQLIATLPLLALAGCTSRLELSAVTPLGDAPQTAATVQTGIPYVLYYDRFTIETTYRIANCAEFELTTEPTVTEVVAQPDPEHTYALDPNSLAGLLKTSSVSAEYNADGSLASINAKAEDHTAEFIGAIAKAGAGIVKIVAAGGGEKGGQPLSCDADTLKDFNAYTAQKDVVKAAKNAIDLAQAEFDAEKAKVDATAGRIPEPLQARFNEVWMALDAATGRLVSAKARLAQLADPISYTKTTVWPNAGSDFEGRIDPDSDLGDAIKDWTGISPNLNPGDGFIHLSLKPVQAGGMAAYGLKQLQGNDLKRGLPYRSAVRGTLTINAATSNDKGETVLGKQLFQKDYTVRQLGRVFQLPCVNGPFSSTACSLAFNDKGQLTKGGTENNKAPLTGVSDVVNSLVESSGSAAESLRARAEKRKGAAMKAKQDELDMLELDGKLAAARKVATGTKTDQQVKEELILGYETDLKLITARKALEDAQNDVTK